METWFEQTTGLTIACFVLEDPGPFFVDPMVENSRRVCQRTAYPQDGQFKGRPFLVATDWIQELKRRGIGKVLPLTPGNRERFCQMQTALEQGLELVSAVHPSVSIQADAIIHPGVWINTGCHIGYKAEVESGVIINTRTQIDHHNFLERCSQLDPAVTTAGNVTLRECCHVHMGAIVINRLEIGADAIVGAGAVVIRDVPPGSTVVGVPAQAISYRRERT